MIYYTDGSCTKNGKAVNEGGFGIVALNDDGTFAYSYSKRNENTTNNREELRAILRVMLIAGADSKQDWIQPPVVYSDSAYCVNTFNDWMFRWANNNWIKADGKTPENLDLIQAYYGQYMKGYRIDLRKIKGHAGHEWNELADKLATGKISPLEVCEKYETDELI